jgi:hypothetical protein
MGVIRSILHWFKIGISCPILKIGPNNFDVCVVSLYDVKSIDVNNYFVLLWSFWTTVNAGL